MRAFKPSPHVVPFCRQAWKVPAALLILFFFGTIAWGVHLVRDHRDQLSLAALGGSPVAGVTVGAPPMAQGVVMSPQSAQGLDPVRLAMVNIAGLAKGGSGNPGNYVSAGSGVLINPRGYVVTALHLVQDLAEVQVRVQTPYGPRQYPAKTFKVVPEHDLALIKIVSQDVFPYLALGHTPLPRVGEPVQALGDPLGTEAVQRQGAVARMELTEPVLIRGLKLTHLIQTDAVFHWAQSGGPLVNDRGLLVGINLAVEDAAGRIVGYAVPANVLVTHFQDVVTFAKSSPATVSSPTGAVAVDQQPAPREPRVADRWWQKAQGMLGLGLGKHVAMPLPSASPAPVDPAHVPSSPSILGYTPGSFFGLLLLGFVSGVSGGMMTMGGGIIKVTGLMWFFGYGMLLVRPVAYITNIFMYGAAVLRYRRQGLLRFEFVKPLVPWAMGGMVLGYFIGNVMSKTAIQWLLGVFAFLLGVKMLVEISESRVRTLPGDEELDAPGRSWAALVWLQRYFGTRLDDETPVSEWRHPVARHGVLGLPMGVVSGILGITGGVIEVPLQRYIARMPLRSAIANSATLVFFSSLVGSVVALWHGVQSGSFEMGTPLVMALILTPGAFAGGMVGAWLTSVISLNTLRWIYAALMFVIAVRMFLS
ncbi:MAG: TSUP family transporter [Magnetococcales bacterium]|nr:TSUP family transporter [Magnetococcales bacterium]MBF0157547.1 TSUP family transporter [Magnetococcales bacterium]